MTAYADEPLTLAETIHKGLREGALSPGGVRADRLVKMLKEADHAAGTCATCDSVRAYVAEVAS